MKKLHSIFKSLLSTTQPLWRYSLFAFLISIVPSAIFFSLARGLAIAFELDLQKINPPARELTWVFVVVSLILAPLLETLLLIGFLSLIRQFILNVYWLSGFSAFIWGGIHGIYGVLWFFGTVWSFFIFSYGYLMWSKKSFVNGFFAAALPHAFINVIVIVLITILKQ